MAVVKSMRGENIDFNRLTSVNANTVALGNGKVNAQGDILGQRGEVLKTQSQIEMEYRQRQQQQANQEKAVNIKKPITGEQLPPAAFNPQQNILPQASDLLQRPVRRKQVDSDE